MKKQCSRCKCWRPEEHFGIHPSTNEPNRSCNRCLKWRDAKRGPAWVDLRTVPNPENQRSAKLKTGDVLLIKKFRDFPGKAEKLDEYDLSQMFGVTVEHIRAIWNGRHWAGVEG
jgi:hypothetical protein